MKLEIDVNPLELFYIIRKEVYDPKNIGLHHLNDYMAYEIQMLCYALHDYYEDVMDSVIDLDTILDNLCVTSFVVKFIRMGYKSYGVNSNRTTHLYEL